MLRPLIVLLTVSLAVNAWLLVRRGRNQPFDTSVVKTAGSLPKVARPQTAPARPLLAALAHSEKNDLGELAKALRAAGATEDVVRATVEGFARRRYRDAMANWRSERWRQAWWKGSGRGAAGAPSLRTLVTEPLRKLLGDDPFDVEDAAARYDFLPPEKQRRLALIDLDYADLQRGPGGMFSRAATKVEAAEEELLARERRKDLFANLTPEERAEYDLRFGGTAGSTAARFATMAPTEQEFRALKPLLDAQEASYRDAGRDRAVTVAAEQRTMDKIVAAIGYDRAVDFLWGVSGPYDDVTQIMRESNRPVSNAAQVFQLAAEAGSRAAAIHYDTTLSGEQKQAALLALQQNMRPQLDALVAPGDQARLPEEAIRWFRVLAEGRYEQPRPLLLGSGRMITTPISVSTPPTTPPEPVPIARKGG